MEKKAKKESLFLRKENPKAKALGFFVFQSVKLASKRMENKKSTTEYQLGFSLTTSLLGCPEQSGGNPKKYSYLL